MDTSSRSTPDAPATPVPDPQPADSQDPAGDPAVIYSRFPMARFDTAPTVDPAAAGAAAGAALGATYQDPAVAVIAPHVDVAFYRATYPDIGRTRLDPVLHYHRSGWREGRRPNLWFDTRYYLQNNPDIRAAGIDPLQHFISSGRREGRLPRRPGGEGRGVADQAMPPADRKPGYDAPRAAQRLDAAALADMLAARCIGARGLVVSASHDRYIDVTGGMQIFIADEQMLFNGDRFAYLHLSPTIARPSLAPEDDAETGWLQLVLDGRFIGLCGTEDVAAALRGLPAATAPVRIFVVHSVFGHRLAGLTAIAEAMAAAHRCFWVHDYASICEGYNLLRDDAAFCHAPAEDSMACRVCVYGGRRAGYRAAMREMFTEIGFHVLAPSQAALALWLRAAELPYRSARVHANCRLEEGPPAPAAPDAPRFPIRVAFVGYPLAHKGWPLYRDLVQQLRVLDGYRFHHFTSEESLLPMDGLVGVTLKVDRYDRFAAVAALAAHEIDLVLVLSPWPETFSYVTHEALAAGADVVTLAGSGNVADTVRQRQRGVVLRDADALLRFFRDQHAVRYTVARRRAGIRPGMLRLTGTTATVALAEAAEPAPLATDDPDLRVIAGGALLAPDRDGPDRGDDVWRFTLPPDAGTVRLVSRSVVPAALRQGMKEQRRLGVAVQRMLLDGVVVPHGDARRESGWHGAEEAWEWTSGDATLAVGGARLLELTLAWPQTYPRSPFGAEG